MSVIDLLKKTFLTPNEPQDDEAVQAEAFNIKYNVLVMEFSEAIDRSSGEVLAALLRENPHLNVSYFNEPFNKSFL